MARARSIAVSIKRVIAGELDRQADLVGALAGDAARRQHDVGGHVPADRARQPLRAAAARRQAEQAFRQAEPRRLSRR